MIFRHVPKAALLLAVFTAPCPAQFVATKQTPKLNDAPHLFLDDDGNVTARWVQDGKLHSRQFEAGEPIDLPEFRHLLGDQLELREPRIYPGAWEQPDKMLVLCDVEGQYDALLRFLQANGVVDAQGHWAFGKGHLVGVGDMVDRGRQVTETLLLFYRLSLEATAAGGHLHFVLGNHEVMLMGGDIRYTDQKYKDAAALMGIPCRGLLGADTVVGRWLRTCNSIERIGDLIFVHAGISTTTAGEKLDIDQVNADIRSVIGVLKAEIRDPRAKELAWGRSGPLWYRGYFAQHVAVYGPVQSAEDMDRILDDVGATRIVVGHTHVERVIPMFEDRLIPIDITWTRPDDVRALLVEGDEVELVDIQGQRTYLELEAR